MFIVDGVIRAGGPRMGGLGYIDNYSFFSIVLGGVFIIMGYILFRKSFKK